VPCTATAAATATATAAESGVALSSTSDTALPSSLSAAAIAIASLSSSSSSVTTVTAAATSAAAAAAAPVNATSNDRFQIDFKAVKEAAQQVLLLPAIHAIKVQTSHKRRTRTSTHDNAHNLRIAKLERRSNLPRPNASGLINGITASQPELLQAVPEDIHSFMDNNLSKYHYNYLIQFSQ
jgi:hypothetical protein